MIQVRLAPENAAFSLQEKLSWLRLARTENVGPVTFHRLLEIYGTAEKALEALPSLSKRGGRAKPLTAPPLQVIESEYESLRKIDGDIVCAREESYPVSLAALDDAPPVISVIGDLSLLKKPCMAIVGSRNASLNGRKFTEKLAVDLGRAGMTVVSGLARGIDTAAHEGSLDSGTIAVVAGGIDVIYPPENKALYARIVSKGLIVAESPLAQQPFSQSFPRRNRIISGLSQGIVVVEATFKSGSLITARLAGEQGRDVYAVPGHPLDPRAEGTNALIRDGAILIRSAGDILEHMVTFPGKMLHDISTMQESVSSGYGSDDTVSEEIRDRVISCLSFTPSPIDDLVRTLGCSAAAIQIALLELELAGRVQRLPRHRVCGIAA